MRSVLRRGRAVRLAANPEQRRDDVDRMQQERPEPTLQTRRFRHHSELPEHGGPIVIDPLSCEPVLPVEGVHGAELQKGPWLLPSPLCSCPTRNSTPPRGRTTERVRWFSRLNQPTVHAPPGLGPQHRRYAPRG